MPPRLPIVLVTPYSFTDVLEQESWKFGIRVVVDKGKPGRNGVMEDVLNNKV
jgi:hypothetical protein